MKMRPSNIAIWGWLSIRLQLQLSFYVGEIETPAPFPGNKIIWQQVDLDPVTPPLELWFMGRYISEQAARRENSDENGEAIA